MFEALNLIIESKYLPIDVNNLTIELHSPVEAKEKLAILLFCNLIIMTFDDTLRDGSSFGKLTNLCY